MKTIIFFIGALFSFFIMASDVSYVNILLKNPSKLDEEILSVEQKEKQELGFDEINKLEKLKFNLIQIKRYRIDLEKQNTLDEAIEIANNSKWSNTSIFLSKIKMICLNSKKIENECFLSLSEVNDFLINRKMPESSKIQLQKLANDYSKYLEARIVVSDQFLDHTNRLIAEAKKIRIRPGLPLAVVKLEPAQSMSSAIETSLFGRYFDYLKWIVLAGGVGLLLLTLIFRKIKKNKIKRFYKDVFYITKRQRIPTKFYGKIKLSKVSKLKRVDSIYLNLLNSTGILKSKLDVRLKNRGENLLIETVIYSNMPIQDFSKEESFHKFSQELENAEKEMMMLGGELHLSNSFDHQGKFVSSSFTIVI